MLACNGTRYHAIGDIDEVHNQWCQYSAFHAGIMVLLVRSDVEIEGDTSAVKKMPFNLLAVGQRWGIRY
jgi:hypothetical protein